MSGSYSWKLKYVIPFFLSCGKLELFGEGELRGAFIKCRKEHIQVRLLCCFKQDKSRIFIFFIKQPVSIGSPRALLSRTGAAETFETVPQSGFKEPKKRDWVILEAGSCVQSGLLLTRTQLLAHFAQLDCCYSFETPVSQHQLFYFMQMDLWLRHRWGTGRGKLLSPLGSKRGT